MFSCVETSEDHFLSAYRFDLPQEQIAQYPVERGSSRLFVIDRDGKSEDSLFVNLPDFLPPKALLVVNNSKVIPARLIGYRQGGGKSEFLLLTPFPLLQIKKMGNFYSAEAEGLLKPSKRIHIGDCLVFDDIAITVLEKKAFGQHKVLLRWNAEKGDSRESLQRIFTEKGHLPLPPYIHRPDTQEDMRRYQTVYAKKAGSVAAPTAGLHFTKEMKNLLEEKGFEWTELTLHVGYGTFSPVRCENIDEHIMHAEFVELHESTVNAIQRAKAENRAIIAVGTTSVRVLEGIVKIKGKLCSYCGWINLFIRPGFVFKVIDGMITNFHLPESTLLMLVSALTGREKMLQFYAEAVKKGYRFFSYGDSMLIK